MLHKFWRPFFESQSLTSAMFLPLIYFISSKHMFIAVSYFDAWKYINYLKPDTSGSIFPNIAKQRSIPHPGKALQIKFPTHRAQKIVKCPSLPWVLLKFRFDQRMTFVLCLSYCTVHAMLNDREDKRYAVNKEAGMSSIPHFKPI